MAKILKFLRGKKNDKENFGKEFESKKPLDFDQHRSELKAGAYRNNLYDQIDEDGEDASSEVTLTQKVMQNPYHVVTQPKTTKGPRSFAGENIGKHRRSIADRGRDSSFRSEFLPTERKRTKPPRVLNQPPVGILKEIGNKSVAWAQSPNKWGRRIKKFDNDNDDDEEWMARRMQQYERRIQELSGQLELAINAHRKERQRRKYYQNQLQQQTEMLRLENHQYRTALQSLNSELNYLRLFFKKETVGLQQTLPAGPVVSSGPIGMPSITPGLTNNNIYGYHNLGSTNANMVTHRMSGLNMNNNDIHLASIGAGEALSIFTSSFNSYQGRGNSVNDGFLLGRQQKPKDLSLNVNLNGNSIIGDEVRNFRDQHSSSFSGSSRQADNENFDLQDLKAEMEANAARDISENSFSDSKFNSDHLSPLISPEVGRKKEGVLNRTHSAIELSPISRQLFRSDSTNTLVREDGFGDDGYSTESLGGVSNNFAIKESDPSTSNNSKEMITVRPKSH